MDNLDNDNFGVEDVQKIVDVGKNIAGSIVKRAKTKKAQKIADAGSYWTLTPYQKSLIGIPAYISQQTAGKGITQEAIKSLARQTTGTPIETIVQALQLASGVQTPSTTPSTVAMEQAGQALLNQDANALKVKLQKAMPYILGVTAIGVVVYFISKK